MRYGCLLPVLSSTLQIVTVLAAMTCYSGFFCIVHMTCYSSLFLQVNDGYARSLEILSKKLKFVQVNPLINASKALKDITQELERLRQKALSKVTSSGPFTISRSNKLYVYFLLISTYVTNVDEYVLWSDVSCPSFPAFTISGFQPHYRDFLCYEKAWN